ncbi:hypothetical protein E0K89_019435 [Aquicoccus sp. SCR17]|nr:hypothetical protein [Carideicomes alvinocaridis]
MELETQKPAVEKFVKDLRQSTSKALKMAPDRTPVRCLVAADQSTPPSTGLPQILAVRSGPILWR